MELKRLGTYEILSPLGAGGMGEVYRAKDTKLGRDVALKILPASFTNDPERVARFRREAQVLASLNHPHIAQIHGMEEANGTQFLVLELVDGESLDRRIARGPIPVDEALGIAKQIAEALEAAHEKGIIHRDLKPANIALTADGQVKVLDFGLAKATEAMSGAASDAMNSPTITSPAVMTGVGVILGTAAYMAPEQAKGRAADKRCDIWAFGCVLYEMLSGKRPFEGVDITETIAAVVRAEPDWNAVPRDVSPSVRLLITRCLEKDRTRRVGEISTARFLLTESVLSMPAMLPAPPFRPLWRRAIPAAVASIVAGALGAAAMWAFRSLPPQTVSRFTYRLGQGQAFTNMGRHVLAISPDGMRMVYVGNNRLNLRSMWEAEATPIAGTNTDALVTSPVISPDGRSIVFWSAADNTLKKIATSGGAAITLCPADNPYGVSWDEHGLVFGQGSHGIMRVADKGGSPDTIVAVKDDEVASNPQLLPDGRSILYTLAAGIAGSDRWETAQIVVQRLGSTERKTVIRGGADARYLPTGHLVYALGGVVFAVPFDLRRLEVVGGPVPIIEGVARASGGLTGVAQFATSRTGTLIYVAGAGTIGTNELADLDLNGTIQPLKLSPGGYVYPRISPDGRWLAVEVDRGSDADVWVYDRAGTSAIRQLTFGGRNRVPIWTRDGARVAFQSDREGDLGIFWQRADGVGPAERLTKADKRQAHIPYAWSPKTDRFLFGVVAGRNTALWAFSQPEKKAEPFAAVQSSGALNAVFSPDGRWVAYSIRSTEGGPNATFVQPDPPTGTMSQIGSFYHPLWSPDGRELYVGRAGIYAVDVGTQPSFTFGNPRLVTRSGVYSDLRNFDIAPDGKHFVIVRPSKAPLAAAGAGSQIKVVEHWFEELKARVPTK